MEEVVIGTVSKLFDDVYNNLVPTTYGGRLSELLKDEDLELDDILSIIDFKGRRVLVYGTLLGTLLVVENKTLTEVSYFIQYGHESRLVHILPYKIIGTRDMEYIVGNEAEDIPDIIDKINDLLLGSEEEGE